MPSFVKRVRAVNERASSTARGDLSSYPFTDPKVTPFTKNLCKNG